MKISSAIRNLENRARKGNLKATFELAQHYESGKFEIARASCRERV